MTAALPWAYRSPYTLAFHRFDDECTLAHTHTHTHRAMHACSHIYSGASPRRICTHTVTHIPFTSSPTWINSPAAPENALLWCHLQSHHFKGTKNSSVPSAQGAKSSLSLPLLSFCPLMVIPLQNVHTRQRENYTVCSTIRYSWVSAHWHSLCTTVTMTGFLYPSSLLLTWKKLPWRTNLCALTCLFCEHMSEFICNCVHAF